MKKLLTIVMALIMIMSLAACEESDAGSTPSNDQVSEAPDVTLVNKVANYVSLLVPSDFGEFADNNGAAVAAGPNSSISVTPTFEMGGSIEDITEEYMLSLIGDTYSNIEVLAFENPVEVAGTNSVILVFTGDGKTSGKSMTVYVIGMYYTLNDVECEQLIMFTYQNGANTSLETNMEEIVESISLG